MTVHVFRSPNDHAKVNSVAIRCFRDIGDGDYVAARLAIRAQLGSQFLWSAAQAVEKYLKCILMLNRINTRDLDHKIVNAFARIHSELPFKIQLDVREQELFDHLARWDSDRYLITSFELEYEELLYLDKLVWRLRQYCQPLDVEHYNDKPSEKVLRKNIERIENGLTGHPAKGYIEGGQLENILRTKSHPARSALIWKNFRYSSKPRKGFYFPVGFQAVNAPLYLYPEVAQESAKWMRVKSQFVEGCNALAKQRKKEASDSAKAAKAALKLNPQDEAT